MSKHQKTLLAFWLLAGLLATSLLTSCIHPQPYHPIILTPEDVERAAEETLRFKPLPPSELEWWMNRQI